MKRLLMMVLVLVVMAGCSREFVNPDGEAMPPSLGYAVQALEASHDFYMIGMTAAGELHQAGVISDELAAAVVAGGRIYYLSHNAAQAAVENWFIVLERRGDTESAKAVAGESLMHLARRAMEWAGEFEEMTGHAIGVPGLIDVESVARMFGVEEAQSSKLKGCKEECDERG